MVQRHGGSDAKHEFGGIRERNTKPSVIGVQQCVARRIGTKTYTFNALTKVNTSGCKSIYTHEITAELKRK